MPSRPRPRTQTKPSLLDSLIPEPDHPTAMRRTFSVGVLSTFLLLFVYESCAAAAAPLSDGAGGRVRQWMWGQSVNWGREGSAGAQWVVGPADEALGVDDQADTAMASDASASSDEGYSVATVDWQRYVWHEDLKWKEGDGRLIVLGDIHGMVDSMKSLLERLNSTSDDTVVLIGDLVAKHPSIDKSLETVRYARQQGFEAVRGNHDQDVIAWRNWMDEHRKWLRRKAGQVDVEEADDDEATLEGEAWLDVEEPPKDLFSDDGTETEALKIPKGWIWKSQHFEIARRLPKKDFKWMLQRSLTLHVRSMHTYFVHAGMLPWERPLSGRPKPYSAESLANSIQPGFFSPNTTSDLSSLKLTDGDDESNPDDDVSILLVKENRDPFTLLNVRGLKQGRKVTKSGKKGTPWYWVWNDVMKDCAKERRKKKKSGRGFRDGAPWAEAKPDDGVEEGQTDGVDDEVEAESKRVCRPLGIVYGHWAAKGLTTKRYSIGLDSGCVYGRSLSALVLGDPALASAADDTSVAARQIDSEDDDDGDDDEDGEEIEAFEELSGQQGLRRRKVKIQGRSAFVYNLPCQAP